MLSYLSLIFTLIASHLLGDYFLQSSYLAEEKKKSWYALFVHCFLYLVPFFVFFGFTWHLTLLFALHLIVDALKARGGLFGIQVDQTLHYLSLLVYLL